MEMGAGRSCSSWIDKILKHDGDDKPHVAIPVDAKGTPDNITIARSLAKLVSHRVKVNLDPLFYGSMLDHYHAEFPRESKRVHR
jgi:acyl transferase domain-containing protein